MCICKQFQNLQRCDKVSLFATSKLKNQIEKKEKTTKFVLEAFFNDFFDILAIKIFDIGHFFRKL